MFETLLIKPIRNILSCFGDLVSEFTLTYHCELIGSRGWGRGEIALNSTAALL